MLNPDIALFRLVNNFAGGHPGIDELGIFAAVFLLPLMGFLLVLAAFTVKRLREEHWYEMPAHAVAATALAYVIRLAIGTFVGRARPFAGLDGVHRLIETDHLYASFPSGHASLAFALAFVVFRRDRDWGIAFLILALLVGAGRVFVGVHYPLDILGGAIVGWGAAWIVHKFEHAHWSKFKRTMRV